MDYRKLGRTGIEASCMGLGCGGHSRLGTGTGKSEAEAENVVRAALDLGINFIDTAESYGTEAIVGRALTGIPRDQVFLSKKSLVQWEDQRSTAAGYRERVHSCLSRLQTDYVDVFHIHGVRDDQYAYACQELLPVLQDLKAEGKIRWIGITEAFAPDPTHKMLNPAIHDDHWDVVMVGFNILNQSARSPIFERTQAAEIGSLGMFAVRRALSRPEVLRDLMKDLAEKGLVDRDSFDPADPLGFLVGEGIAESVEDAAYRFVRHEPGMDVVLSGTGNIEHLKANAESLNRSPLPPEIVERLRKMFARVDSISGN